MNSAGTTTTGTAERIGESSIPTIPTLLTAKQAAKCLAISLRKLWGLTNSKELLSVRVGRCVRYDLADLREFIGRNRLGVQKQ